jgi:hypothetical protein
MSFQRDVATAIFARAFARRLGTVGVLAAAGCSPWCNAASGPSFELLPSVGTASYVAEELRPDGRVFNRESGRLRRTALELRGAWADWKIAGQWSSAHGVLDYVGQTQFGIPLYTATELRREDAAVSLWHVWPLGLSNTSLSLGGGLSALRIARDILPTPISSELTETLRSRQYQLSASVGSAQAFLGRTLNLSLFAAWRRPFAQSLEVDAHGTLDPLVLRPASTWSSQAGVVASMAFGRGITLGLEAGADRFRPGPGRGVTAYHNGLAVGSASYPGSQQRLTHTAITLGLQF